MADNSLEQRVVAIEQMLQDYATVRDLERLERALGEQIAQQGAELRGDVSAFRDETRSEFTAVRDEMRSEFAAVRAEMRSGFGAVRDGIRAGDDETRRVLREEIQAARESIQGVIEQRTVETLAQAAAGDEETRRQMRLLHEDMIARIATLRRG